MGSSSYELSLSYRVSSLRPPSTSRSRAPPLGFRPPSRRQPIESTHASIPSSLRSALGVSHPLDGLLLDLPCGFISPRCHVLGSPCRGFPSCAAAPPRRWPLPSCRLAWPTAKSFRPWLPEPGPAFRALLRAGIRRPRRGISSSVARSPLGFRLLRVLRFLAVQPLSQLLRSWPCVHSRSGSSMHTAFSVSPTRNPTRDSRRTPTRSRFGAYRNAAEAMPR
jgi:hypothetical protein